MHARSSLLLAAVALAATGCCLPGKKLELGQPTWAQELGFPAGHRVLVLHADDAGMLEASNDATTQALANGEIDSASVMMPIDLAPAFVAWALAHPGHDVGLHLTLTSEFTAKLWGPVSPASKVPSLVVPGGSFAPKGPTAAKPRHVEREIRAQIEAARALGLEPTHLDSHMGGLFLRPDYFRAYLCAAIDAGIPPVTFEDFEKTLECLGGQETIVANLLGEGIETWIHGLAPRSPFPRLDAYCGIPKGDTLADVRAAFIQRVENLGPGLYQFLFHPAVHTQELENLTTSWPQRALEADLFADSQMQSFLASPGILRTDWRRLMCRWSCSPCDGHPWVPPPRCV
ncbi:MAG TPA: polysaccharide deacetylase family protein [Thermoanaerobaculia bacterium]|nr:polysaccharide deacetylase family protein [Thermoanaerobaculia bacterium]